MYGGGAATCPQAPMTFQPSPELLLALSQRIPHCAPAPALLGTVGYRHWCQGPRP